ncbi:hypothetical protein M1437_00565 [Patescibacteria group bacterium]|nr:hypothetical protein [Patescibacteria group bacterium]
MVNYDPSKDSWYSPIKVLDEFEKLSHHFSEERLKDGVFKRAFEMFTGAVALLGAYELSEENKYWMQSNNQTTSPDVMAGKQLEGGPWGINLLLTQMEMVDMEGNSPTDDIVQFLKNTKLSSKKSYTGYDMIVLTINRKVPYDRIEVSKQLKELNPKPTIYILGRPVGAGAGDFMISTPYPKLYKPVYFNVDETTKKYRIPERVDFSLSTEKKIKYTKSNKLNPVNTYQILGLDRNAIYKRFRIQG